jgi:mannan endo-1,4-beta-mannosidase
MRVQHLVAQWIFLWLNVNAELAFTPEGTEQVMQLVQRLTVLLEVAVMTLVLAYPRPSNAAPDYRLLGQPNLASTTLATRCADARARFNFDGAGGFKMYGPSGIAIDPRGRLFVTDYGGKRVLTWPDVDSLTVCAAADDVIGAGELAGPESVAVDTRTGAVFVADTLSHTIKGYHKEAGSWVRFVTLGKEGVPGSAFNRFNFPRGLAVDPRGRLFVADDSNNRVLIFDAPFVDGEEAADSIGAGANGGFAGPKGLAMSGDTLFVADYFNNRVLRFTGPFRTPDEVYVASGEFDGVNQPVDVAVHGDGSLLVTDQGNQRIARFRDAVWSPSQAAPTSAFGANMGPEPLGVAADRAGRVYIADYRRFRVLIRDQFTRTLPVSPNSSAAAEALLADLHARPARSVDRVAIGQQLITWEYGAKSDPNAWYGDWLQMANGGFPLPEIMAGETSDLETYSGFAPNQNALNELIRHGKNHHIVMLVWHPNNPVAGANFAAPISTANLRNMVDDATTVGQRWQQQLNRAAAVLQQFQAAGVPVLFRPLHEQNGNFFWWGHNGASGPALRARQQAWITMWRDMVNELTVKKGLNNLLFVFGTNQLNYDEVAPPLTYYPGAGFADVVSIDVYDEQLDLAGGKRGLQHYAALVGTGKPFGLAEFGQSFGDNGTGATGAQWDARTLTTRLRDSYPRTVFANAWYSSVEGNPPVSYVFAIPDVSFGKAMLADPLIDTQ